VIYAYAVCEHAAADPPPRRRGLGGATLRLARADGLAALYSRHRTLRPRPSPEAMWAHERAVEALMERGAVLPMRFGTVLADEAALTAALADRREALAAGLSRVRGRVEVGLRVLPDRPARSAGSGRAYLLERMDEHRAARELHAALAAHARESAVRTPAPPPALLAAAYLVERADAAAFHDRVHELAAGFPGVRAVCTGPWPPYSFVPEEES
jgi:Gas vesicle synthesis protein GvpL/GvpF